MKATLPSLFLTRRPMRSLAQQLAVAGLFLAFIGTAAAQQTQVTPNTPKTGPVTHEEVGTEKITLVRDANLPAGQSSTPTQSLSRQYSTKSPSQVTGPDNNPLDINKIRVITPAQFATLAPDAQKAIEADPYYVVTDKSRKEVMAEFIKTYAQDDLSRALQQSAPAVAVPTPDQGLPTQAEKEAAKAAQAPEAP
jgi:hypothetical protein